MTRGELAKNYFLGGYNCTQAVLMAFKDELSVSEEILLAVGLPMGGGMGRLRQTCGGVSGAVMCLGLLFPEKSKNEIYALVQEFARRFQAKNGSINCGELLSGAGVKVDTSPNAEPRTAEYYKKRPCPLLIADAADILEEMLKEEKRI
ncbi:MAG: C-GCAxxG-C-C family protein [Clostridia bacterium]|nr:C-GCAxxG-C-C family protein [Clostridia bacterium]